MEFHLISNQAKNTATKNSLTSEIFFTEISKTVIFNLHAENFFNLKLKFIAVQVFYDIRLDHIGHTTIQYLDRMTFD